MRFINTHAWQSLLSFEMNECLQHDHDMHQPCSLLPSMAQLNSVLNLFRIGVIGSVGVSELQNHENAKLQHWHVIALIMHPSTCVSCVVRFG